MNGSDGAGIDFATTFTEDGGAVAVVDTDLIITDVDGGVVGTAISASGDIFVVNGEGEATRRSRSSSLNSSVGTVPSSIKRAAAMKISVPMSNRC